jgi:hypothetical protein
MGSNKIFFYVTDFLYFKAKQILPQNSEMFIDQFSLRFILFGFSFLNSGGKKSPGKPWKQTGRAKRKIAPVPTDVDRLSVVAG